jgi:catechol 2,3-dioxygenase-like lactoylglutathione lyase family enzyme
MHTDPVQRVILASSNLQKSVDYWHGLLGLKLYSREGNSAIVAFDDSQAKLELKDIGKNLLWIINNINFADDNY